MAQPTRIGMLVTKSSKPIEKKKEFIAVDKYEEDESEVITAAVFVFLFWWLPLINVLLILWLAIAIGKPKKRTVKTIYYERID